MIKEGHVTGPDGLDVQGSLESCSDRVGWSKVIVGSRTRTGEDELLRTRGRSEITFEATI
jgi:hypothetical protein